MKTNPSELPLNQSKSARRWLALSLLSLFMLLAWAACNPNQNAAVSDSPSGIYVLVTVDGTKVPCTVQHEGHAVPIQSGTFIINADGTCSSKMLLSGQTSAIAVEATYTQEGSKLTMRWAGAGMTVGTVRGTTFTMTNEGMILVYEKQKKNSS